MLEGVVAYLAAALFVFAGHLALDDVHIDSDWARTTGQVVEIETRKSSDGSTRAPVVEFEVDGQKYQVKSRLSKSFSMLRVGSPYPVAYNPKFPSEAKTVEKLWNTWWLYLFPIIGVCLAILSTKRLIGIARKKIRSKKKEKEKKTIKSYRHVKR